MDARDDIIESIFGTPGRTAVLRVLASASAPLTGRQVGRLAGLSHAGANRALEHLSRLGVVSRVPVGSAFVHELERESPVVSDILLPTIEAERRIAAARRAETGEVPADILAALVEGFDPLRIILFGSRARGDADARSDFDLLVVLPEVADKHATMVAMLLALGKFAVPVDIIPTDPTEIAARGSVAGSVLRRALEEGEVVYERRGSR